MQCRNSFTIIPVRALELSREYVPLALAYVLVSSRLAEPMRTVIAVCFWCHSIWLVLSIFSRWTSHLYTIDSEGICHRYGVLFKTDVYLPWSSVAALEVYREPIRSIGRSCKIVVRAASGPDRVITLDAVSERLVDEIRAVSGLHVADSAGGSHVTAQLKQSLSRDAGTQPSDRRLRRHVVAASWTDLFVMSLTYAQFGLFVPFVFGTYSEFSEPLGLPGPLSVIDSGLSLGRGGQIVLFAGLCLLSILYGFGLTLVRHWGFRAAVEGDSLVLEEGLLATRGRTIPLDRLVGTVLYRNTLELALGRGRLALLTRDAGYGLGTNVVLPALTMRDIRYGLESFNTAGRKVLTLDSVRPTPGRVWWIVGVRLALLVCGALLVLTAFALWRFWPVALAVMVLAGTLLINSCYSDITFDVETDHVVCRRGLFWRAVYWIPTEQVHVLGIASQPWSRALGLRQVSVHYFAAGERRLRSWQHVESISALHECLVRCPSARSGTSIRVPMNWNAGDSPAETSEN